MPVRKIFWQIFLADQAAVGGQAIIEGVMMRSRNTLAMAVRRKNGEIVSRSEPYISLAKRVKLLGIPVVRGFVQLVESLSVGLRALNYSADIALEDEKKEQKKPIKKSWVDTLLSAGAMVVSLVVALGIFMYLPLAISGFIKKDQNPFLFNLLAGVIRIAFFLIYLWLISRWKDIQRVFEYHGAEHKSIFAFEAGLEVNVENAKKYTTHHPRCGTSFLLIVAVICILIFALIDGLVALFIGPYPNVQYRFLVHLFFIPLVSGVSYEILKASSKTQNAVVQTLIKPGLWLQRITTREPNDGQLEVAVVALKAAVGNGEA